MRSRSMKLTVATLVLCLLGLAIQAVVVKKPQAGLADLVATSARVNVQANVQPSQDLRSEAASMAAPALQDTVQGWDRFITENGPQWQLSVDRRTGRTALAAGSGVPWVPGVGNALRQADLREVLGPSGRVNSAVVTRLALRFIRQYPELFGVDPSDLEVNPLATGEHGGYLWYVQFQRKFHGIPVEKSFIVFRVNNGNLIQFGGDFLGEIRLDPIPTINLETAQQILGGYIGGFQPGDRWLDEGHLSVIPMAPQGDVGTYTAEPGKGIDYHLTYTLVFRREGEMGTWSAMVDAHTGEVLSFRDDNEYGSIKGGIYITSNLDTETVRPMAFANSASGTYANAAGVYPQASGTVTTTLAGKYVTVNDSCGSISLSGTAPADINLGTSAGTDCTVPSTGGGAGDTHAARTTYYHLTLWKEKAMAWLPSNTWLQGSLSDKVNLSQTCNAYWDGAAVNFFKSGGGCSNTGELPTVFLHEVGHGLDSNDGSGTSSVGSSEMYADTNAVLMTHQSCIGVNFIPGAQCSGYGNACTGCTGIRDADYTKHSSQSPATPAQLSGATGYHCSTSSTYPGPCGYEGHCESYIGSEANFDVGGRDLPAAGFDTNTSWYIMERLFYLSRPTSTDTYTCSGTSANGCGAGNWYTTYLAVDDDNGNLTDGTPHAAAIYAAFNRHAIACTTGSHTSYSACGTIGQPTLTATAGSGQVSLSWTAASGATKYKVLRGELGPTASMSIVATPTTTTYTDTTVAVGITYYYSVVAIGSSDACFGALAAVQSATPTAGATYSISGTLSGAATSGVTMTLSGTANATTTTATGGTYTFSGLANGSYTVTPSLSGYTFSPVNSAVTVSSANVTGVNFTSSAVPTYSISGTVSGAVTSGVTVSLSGAKSATTATATGGTFTFSGLANGSYTVTPSLSGYTFSPANSAVTVSGANVTGVNFTSSAVPTYSISGTVSGTATSGVTMTLSGAKSATTATATGGTYTFSGLANGSYTVTPSLSGYVFSPASTAVTVSSANVTGINFTSSVAPAGVVNGDFETGSLSGWTAGTGTGTIAPSASTAQKHGGLYSAYLGGNNTLGSATTCTLYQNVAVPAGGGTLSFWYYAQNNDTITYDWQEMDICNASGTVLVSPLAKGVYNQKAWTQVTYNMAAYAGQTIQLKFTARDDGYADSTVTFMYVDDVVITPPAATYTVSGTVTLSGAGLGGVTVSTTGATATTNTSGAFTLSGLANGTYTVTPTLSGYTFSPASSSVTVSGANVTGVNFAATKVTGPVTLFTDGFESAGWSTAQVSGTAGAWSLVTSSSYPSITAHGGTHWADFNSYTSASGSQTRLYKATGFAVASTYTTVTLTFWMYHDTGYSTYADKVQAQVSTNGTTWTNVGTAVARYNGTTGWAQVTIDLSAYKGQTVQLGFLGISAYGNDEYLDDVTVVAQ